MKTKLQVVALSLTIVGCIIATVLISPPPQVSAQGYPINYELQCPTGSIPISGPTGSSYNGTTGKFRANTCTDASGNIYINVSGISSFTGASSFNPNPTNPTGAQYKGIITSTCTMSAGTCSVNAGASFSLSSCWAMWNGTGTLTGVIRATLSGLNNTCTVTSSVGTDTAQMNLYWLSN